MSLENDDLLDWEEPCYATTVYSSPKRTVPRRTPAQKARAKYARDQIEIRRMYKDLGITPYGELREDHLDDID